MNESVEQQLNRLGGISSPEPFVSQEGLDSSAENIRYSSSDVFLQNTEYSFLDSPVLNLIRSSRNYVEREFLNSPVVSQDKIDDARKEFPGIDIPDGTKEIIFNHIVNDFTRQRHIDFVNRHTNNGFIAGASKEVGNFLGTLADPVSFGLGIGGGAVAKAIFGSAAKSLGASIAARKAEQLAIGSGIGGGFGVADVTGQAALLASEQRDLNKIDVANTIMSSAIAGAVMEVAIIPGIKRLYGKQIRKDNRIFASRENIEASAQDKPNKLHEPSQEITVRESDLHTTTRAQGADNIKNKSIDVEPMHETASHVHNSEKLDEILDKITVMSPEDDAKLKDMAVQQLLDGKDVNIDAMATSFIEKQGEKLRSDFDKTNISKEEMSLKMDETQSELESKLQRLDDSQSEIKRMLKESKDDQALKDRLASVESEIEETKKLSDLNKVYKHMLFGDLQKVTAADAKEFLADMSTSSGNFKHSTPIDELEPLGKEDITIDDILNDIDDGIIKDVEDNDEFSDLFEEDISEIKKSDAIINESKSVTDEIVKCLTGL